LHFIGHSEGVDATRNNFFPCVEPGNTFLRLEKRGMPSAAHRGKRG
jgi:hypothetical protein